MLRVLLTKFGGVDGFTAEELSPGAPGPGEIRVRVRAVGFNPVDVKLRQGNLGGSPPLVLGRDVSGVVDAVGDGVTGVHIGDRVYARSNEAYAESVVIPAALVARMPETLSFAEAAALPVAGLTAYQCVVEKARVQPGEAVLVAGGSGGVGSIAVQLLQYRGAAPILVTAGSDESAAYLIDHLGVAPACVLRYDGKTVGELAEQVLRRTGGARVQAAFDFVGKQMKRLCFEVVGVDGHVVSIVEEPPGFDLDVWDEHASPLVLRSASLHFVQLAARLAYAPPETWTLYREQLAALARLVDTGAISKVPITEVGRFSVDTVRRAHMLLEGGHVRGKLVATTGE